MADLLAGRGAGYALAAELNHYPGPTHTLEFAGHLGLTADQDRTTRAILAEMQQEARALGARLVALEADLDGRFREGLATAPEVDARTREIAGVEGELRAAHLRAHLRMREVLSPAQVAAYDQLRGYLPSQEPAQHGAAASTAPHQGDHAAGGH